MKNLQTKLSDRQLAYRGALITVAAVFFYSLLVLVYVITRSTISLVKILPGEPVNNLLIGTNFSILYSVAVVSILVAGFSSIGGATGALFLHRFLTYFNPSYKKKKAAWLSVIFSTLAIIVIYLVLYVLFREKMSSAYMPTFLFWYVIPASIFFSISVIAGIRLNEFLRKD